MREHVKHPAQRSNTPAL